MIEKSGVSWDGLNSKNKSFHEYNPLFNIIAPQALTTHRYWEQFTNVLMKVSLTD